MASERVLVVGAGSISNAWFPPLAHEKVQVVGVVDLNLDAARAQVAKYHLNCPTGTQLRPMIDKVQPDFVLDLTVPEAHCQVTCAALKAGCHVISEKPMAASMAEARKMVQTAEDTGKLYMVSQSRRWEPLHDSITRTIAAGKIGPLTTVNCDFYIGAHFGGFRDKMPSPLILDMSIHHFDLARCVTGANPVAVYAHEFNPANSWYEGNASASVIFEMTDGIVFTYRASWCSEGCHTSWHGNWRFIGASGTMLYEDDHEPVGQVVSGKSGFIRPLKDLKMVKPALKYAGMHGALREMLRFLRTGEKPQTECHDNIQSLAMVCSAVESGKKGKRIEVKAGE